MAAKSLTYVLLVFYVAVLAAPAMVRVYSTGAAAAPGVEDFSFRACIAFIGDASQCLRDVFKQTTDPHPSCCTAISKLNDCSPSLVKDIPADKWNTIKHTCGFSTVTIPQTGN